MAGPPGGRTNVGEQSPFDGSNRPLPIAANPVTGQPAVGIGFSSPGGIGPNAGWAYSGSPLVVGYTQTGTFIGNPAATDLRKIKDNVRGEANLDGYNDYAIESVYKTDIFDIKYTFTIIISTAILAARRSNR